MTSLIITFSHKRISLCIFLVFLCFLSLSQAREQRKETISNFFEVHVNSLVPLEEEPTCKHSSGAGKKQGVSLEVVHRHGPCSKLKSATTQHVTPSHSDILSLDQNRVDSIHARISGNSPAGEKAITGDKSVNLPARSGASIGTGNYIVTVGVGTPQKDLSLVFDTGSDLTWTQCKPCAGSCYEQVDPIFDPSSSSSYVNISCESSACNKLVSATGRSPMCFTSTCVYQMGYGDGSISEGFFAKERLSLTSTDYIDGFLFGCGENNFGLFEGAAGLIGLGQDSLSLVSQAANKYGKYFSYCLPSSASSTGHLTLGQGGTKATSFSYTPLVTSSGNTGLYFLNLESISVGGKSLSISSTVFTTPGTIIDSGTVITRLPPQAYTALSTAFKQHMSSYPSAPKFSIFDTCYDFTNYTSVSIPKITLYFAGGGILDVPANGILYFIKISEVCLAFATNKDVSDVAIVGNVQQKGFDVVYDVDGARVGFGSNGC